MLFILYLFVSLGSRHLSTHIGCDLCVPISPEQSSYIMRWRFNADPRIERGVGHSHLDCDKLRYYLPPSPNSCQTMSYFGDALRGVRNFPTLLVTDQVMYIVP
jgi:hypothetical protein